MKKWIASALILAILVFGSVIGFNMFKAKMISKFLANRPIPEFPVTATTLKLKIGRLIYVQLDLLSQFKVSLLPMKWQVKLLK